MTQITQIEQDISKEITVDAQGHGFISAKGTARLLGLTTHVVLGRNRFPKKLAETLIQQGINPGDRPFNEAALTLIAEYYAYRAQKTTEQAQQVFRTLAAIGTRTWMQNLKGWMQQKPQNQKSQRYRLVTCEWQTSWRLANSFIWMPITPGSNKPCQTWQATSWV